MEKSTEGYMLDLSQYLNNKAFGNLNVPNCSSDFSGLNEFLGYENIVNSFEWKNICIKNYINPEGYDNIVCKGQELFLRKNNGFSSLYIVAVSEFGESIDKFEIEYKNGDVEEIYVKVSDINVEPMYGENVVWRGNTYTKNGNRYEVRLTNAHVFICEKRLSRCEEIIRVKLPDCINMHIFAMMLA